MAVDRGWEEAVTGKRKPIGDPPDPPPNVGVGLYGAEPVQPPTWDQVAQFQQAAYSRRERRSASGGKPAEDPHASEATTLVLTQVVEIWERTHANSPTTTVLFLSHYQVDLARRIANLPPLDVQRMDDDLAAICEELRTRRGLSDQQMIGVVHRMIAEALDRNQGGP